MSNVELPFVSVITPCRNEINYIQEFVDTIFNQDYPTDLFEVIIADGKSNDGTFNKLIELQKSYPKLKVLNNSNQTAPYGLNLAIKASIGSIIIRMDCHAIYPSNYISTLVKNLIDLNADNVGVPLFTIPKRTTNKSIAISKAMSSTVAVGSSLFRTSTPSQPILADTVPFGCFHRDLFNRIGYFSEILTRNQDDEFNNRITKNGGKIYLLPGPIVNYYGRLEIKQLYLMFFQYGLFKPLSNIICGRLSSFRQLAPLGFQLTCFLLFMLACFGLLSFYPLFILLFIYFTTILFFGFQSLDKNNNLTQNMMQLFYFEVATILIHQSYGFGYFLGLFRLIPKFRKEIDLALSR